MNDAQLFTIFLSILGFGWLGFLAGRALGDLDERGWHVPVAILFGFGSIGCFASMVINLLSLVERNF